MGWRALAIWTVLSWCCLGGSHALADSYEWERTQKLLEAQQLELAENPEGKRWRPFIGQMLDEGKHVPPEEAAQLCLRLVSGRADRLSGCLFSVHDDFDAIVRSADAVLQQGGLRLRLRPWPQ